MRVLVYVSGAVGYLLATGLINVSLQVCDRGRHYAALESDCLGLETADGRLRMLGPFRPRRFGSGFRDALAPFARRPVRNPSHLSDPAALIGRLLLQVDEAMSGRGSRPGDDPP